MVGVVINAAVGFTWPLSGFRVESRMTIPNISTLDPGKFGLYALIMLKYTSSVSKHGTRLLQRETKCQQRLQQLQNYTPWNLHIAPQTDGWKVNFLLGPGLFSRVNLLLVSGWVWVTLLTFNVPIEERDSERQLRYFDTFVGASVVGPPWVLDGSRGIFSWHSWEESAGNENKINLQKYLYLYICIYIYIYVCMYIYFYIYICGSCIQAVPRI